MQVKLEERQINLETNQEIMKNNISKILEEQINFNEKFKSIDLSISHSKTIATAICIAEEK